MDWVFSYVPLDSAEIRAILEEVIRTTGSVLSDRRSYNVGRRPGQRPEACKVLGGAWTGPVFVLTHDPPNDEDDPSIRFLSSDIRKALGQALDAAAVKSVMLIGADVAGVFSMPSSTKFASSSRPSSSVMESASSAGRKPRALSRSNHSASPASVKSPTYASAL